MDKPQNGLEFLEALRKKNGKQVQNYRSFSRYLDEKAREKGVPIRGQFELTPLCNFSCKMCYVHLDTNQLSGRKVLPLEIWKDLMHQAWEAGMMHVTLTGGECLIYPGFDELFLYLHSLGCDVSVFTNGYLLDDKRIEFFKQHKPARIQITLYGWNDDVYERVTGRRAFNKVVNNIHKAIDAGLPVRITTTPSAYLGEDVFETIRVGNSITEAFTINSGLFTPRQETGRSDQRDDLDVDFYVRIFRLFNELHGIGTNIIEEDKLPSIGGPHHECDKCGILCGGGRSGFVMDWKGTLMPCNRFNNICSYPLQVGFKEAWTKINYEVNHWPRVPECEGCAYEGVCHKCAANMLQYAEPGKQPIKFCERIKRMVQQGIMHIPDCE